MPSPSYLFKIGRSIDGVNGMTNVELLTDGERYFYPPTLENDFILRQPLASGGQFERGYQSFTWKSDLWRGQYQYLFGTLLQGSLQNAVYFQTQRTIDSGAYSVWLGTLMLPQMPDFQRNYQLYANMNWTFIRCTRVG
jgi:predicted Zn-dependent peptidase